MIFPILSVRNWILQKLLFSSQLVLCGRAWIDLVGLLMNFMFFSFCLLALNTLPRFSNKVPVIKTGRKQEERQRTSSHPWHFTEDQESAAAPGLLPSWIFGWRSYFFSLLLSNCHLPFLLHPFILGNRIIQIIQLCDIFI